MEIPTHIVDINGLPANLSSYRLYPISGAATISGFFVGINGKRIGLAFQSTINDVSSFADISGAPIAENAVGVVLEIDSDCAIDVINDQIPFDDGNFNMFPIVAAGHLITLGRVSQ